MPAQVERGGGGVKQRAAYIRWKATPRPTPKILEKNRSVSVLLEQHPACDFAKLKDRRHREAIGTLTRNAGDHR